MKFEDLYFDILTWPVQCYQRRIGKGLHRVEYLSVTPTNFGNSMANNVVYQGLSKAI